MLPAITPYFFPSTLTLEKLHLKLHLGVEAAERQIPQEVYVTVMLFFTAVPAACTTDQLEETVCYDKLCTAIKAYTVNKSFKLIEYLGFELYKVTREIIDSSIKIHIIVEKCNPPIEDMHGSAIFSYNDIS